MKINKTHHLQFITTAAIACMLAINCSANAAPKKARPCADDNKSNRAGDSRSNLDEATRANHNSLLPASFYDSNHGFSGF